MAYFMWMWGSFNCILRKQILSIEDIWGGELNSVLGPVPILLPLMTISLLPAESALLLDLTPGFQKELEWG